MEGTLLERTGVIEPVLTELLLSPLAPVSSSPTASCVAVSELVMVMDLDWSASGDTTV